MEYKVVIGLEIHLELLTKTKMFDPSPVSFHAKPNTMISENSLGYPGSLPIVNKKGVLLAIRACQLLNMKISPTLSFERKHYFYIDLPKGYQITQYHNPIGTKGFVDLTSKKITFQQLHIEEDTAKVIREENQILIDYNRSGNPLLEIVTNPDFNNEDEVIEFLKLMKDMMFYGKISNSKLEEGSFRCDVNISLQPLDSSKKGHKVEIKNLNSFTNIKKAISYEIKRQKALLDNNQLVITATRKWDERKQKTILMRRKYLSTDYRFIKETNIMPITISQDLKDQAWKGEGINYLELKTFFKSNKFSSTQIDTILKSGEYEFIKFFYQNQLQDYNYFQILLNYYKEVVMKNNLSQNLLTPQTLKDLTIAYQEKNLDSKVVKKIIYHLLTSKQDLSDLITKFNVEKISGEDTLLKIIKPLITPKITADYLKKPDHIQKYLIGQVLKATQGRAQIKVVIKIINKLLKK